MAPIDLPCNLRDLGGLPTIDGGSTWPGLLFRSDDPGHGDEAAARRLTGELGIRHVIDLRHSSELERAGSIGSLVTRPEVVRHHLPYRLMDADDPALTVPTTAEELGHLYAASVERSADVYAAGIRTLAEISEPALIHCVHGKDRTGVLVALTLSAVGVELSAIVADFARTTENLPDLFAAAEARGLLLGMSRLRAHRATVLFQAPPVAMETLMDTLKTSHGDVLGPLYDAGLTPGDVTRLRHRLVGPS